MKRKTRILLIIIVVIIVLFILIYPMTPVWQKLGLEPFCIQGEFPRLKLVSCSGSQEPPVTALPLPTPGADGPLPIIFDDDGSPDGMVALLYFLDNPLFDVRAVTISYGEAHPAQFAPYVAQLLAALGRTDIPVGYGQDAPLAGNNAFPDPWRQDTETFWGVQLPAAGAALASVEAVPLIIETISTSPTPVTIFLSGSHTNLAEALRLDSTIAGNIRNVYIMGGAVEVPGNIHSDWPEFGNETAEWNIWVDTTAASEVFTSGLDLHLIPLDATRQVLWSTSDASSWEVKGSPEGFLAADLLRMMLDAWSVESAYVWDLVAAVQTTLPSVCPEISTSLQVITSPGPDEGRTMMVDGAANVSVCLNPDPLKVKGLVLSAFQQP